MQHKRLLNPTEPEAIVGEAMSGMVTRTESIGELNMPEPELMAGEPTAVEEMAGVVTEPGVSEIVVGGSRAPTFAERDPMRTNEQNQTVPKRNDGTLICEVLTIKILGVDFGDG